MTINEVFIQVRDYKKVLDKSLAFSSGRMGHSAAEFYKHLSLLRDYLLIPSNIKAGLLEFFANAENIDSLGPIIDLIQPEDYRKSVRYHITAAIIMEIDRLVAKKKKYGQLGLNDQSTYESLQRLSKYLDGYCFKT